MDWQRISSIGLLSQNAKEITTKEYAKSITNRNESLINKIENDLDNGKNGILFMRDDHGLQFSKDVEVFYVSTTIINSLQNWLGEELNKFMKELEEVKDTFDIALCSCGGYGNLIINFIYEMGKYLKIFINSHFNFLSFPCFHAHLTTFNFV